ncbi:MAG: hypothetical protein U0804_08560 [Gemmataceae bacterium]
MKELALAEEGVFVIYDTQGRNWYCREKGENESEQELLFEMMAAQRRAFEQGLSEGGSSLTTILCDRAELPIKLGRRSLLEH